MRWQRQGIRFASSANPLHKLLAPGLKLENFTDQKLTNDLYKHDTRHHRHIYTAVSSDPRDTEPDRLLQQTNKVGKIQPLTEPDKILTNYNYTAVTLTFGSMLKDEGQAVIEPCAAIKLRTRTQLQTLLEHDSV